MNSFFGASPSWGGMPFSPLLGAEGEVALSTPLRMPCDTGLPVPGAKGLLGLFVVLLLAVYPPATATDELCDLQLDESINDLEEGTGHMANAGVGSQNSGGLQQKWFCTKIIKMMTQLK